jgi:hypothetical protein
VPRAGQQEIEFGAREAHRPGPALDQSNRAAHGSTFSGGSGGFGGSPRRSGDQSR